MIRIRFYIEIFLHDIIFYYSLAATQTLNFGYINWTPDFPFTVSFIDIIFGQYVRQGMGKKYAIKNVE